MYERLRQKIGEDITAVMKESEIYPETLAAMMRISKRELKEMIWERDLKLSELTKLLCKIDAELWPLIRTRKK